MTEKRILAVIPSRLASTRLPEKPLRDIAGKTLIQRAWECAKTAKGLDDVVIATDSVEIESAARRFGATTVMTSESLASGSERVFAAAQILAKERAKSSGVKIDSNSPESYWHLVLNVQGDMPFLKGAVIERALEFALSRYNDFQFFTIAVPIVSREEFNNPSKVKVVVAENGSALYFSRAPIPHSRDGEILPGKKEWDAEKVYGFRHIGLYLFRPDAFSMYADSQLSPLEGIEKLEQLRALERGLRIGVCVIPESLLEPFVEVDTPEDLAKACKIALL